MCNSSALEEKNCTKDSNVSDAFINFSGPEAVAVPIVFVIIFIAGMIGNTALLYYFLRKRRLTSPHNIYVMNLAVGDIIMITIAMPFASTIYTFAEWPYGEFICKLSEFTHTFCTAVTIFTITALSIERYAILTMHAPTKRIKMAAVVVFVIWTSSFMLALPDLISAELNGTGVVYCNTYRFVWGESYSKSMTLVKFLFLFAMPLCVIAIFYILIAYTLLRGSPTGTRNDVKQCNTNPREDNSDPEYIDEIKRNKKRKKIAILVLCLIIIFIDCWILRHTYLLWFHFDTTSEYNQFWHALKIVGFCLMYLNSAINPLALVIYYNRYRNIFKMLRTDHTFLNNIYIVFYLKIFYKLVLPLTCICR